MAIVKSGEVTLLDSVNPSDVKLDSTLLHGRLRVAYFSFDTGASGPAVADRVQLVEVPAGARILGIWVVHEAMTSGAGVAGADFGDNGDGSGTADPDRFVTALDMDAASTGKWLLLRHEDAASSAKTLGIGYKYSNRTRIEAKVTGEAWAANKRLDGFVVYTTD